MAEIRDRRDYDGKPSLGRRFNWGLSDMHAAIGRSRLRRLDAESEWRARTARLYGGSGSVYRFVVRVADAEKARQRMADRGVKCILPIAPWEVLHRQKGESPGEYPVAEEASRTLLSVPTLAGDDERGAGYGGGGVEAGFI